MLLFPARYLSLCNDDVKSVTPFTFTLPTKNECFEQLNSVSETNIVLFCYLNLSIITSVFVGRVNRAGVLCATNRKR